jgi:ankyrin repeat protein
VYVAAQEGQFEAIRALCEGGADINTPNKDGFTPAFAAAMKGHVEAIRLLRELGADINTPNDVEFLRALCELGADINATDKDGVTPVCAAAHCGH